MSDLRNNDSTFGNEPPRVVLTRNQTCEMLGGISVSHLRRLIKSGDLEPWDGNASFKPQRRGKLKFELSAVNAFIEKRAKRQPPR